MIQTIKILTLITTVFVLSSFANKQADSFIGTYGVSACDPSQIKLTIHSDQTFYYQDFSVSNKKIIAKGKWSLKGNKVVLKTHEKTQRFHNVWTFDKDGKIAKSRKGLTFYRLIKAE